jgi:hypothetical protein
MVVLVVVSVIPAAIQGVYGEDAIKEFFEVESVPVAMAAVARYLPPSLAAAGLAFADPDGAPVFGIDVSELTFIGMFLYVSMLTSNFVINAFAWDGNGVFSYFLSPITPSAVIIGKNLAVWLFSGILLLECTVAWAVTRGLPGPSALLSGFLVFASTVLGLMIVGNHTSVMFPVRRLISSVNNSPSNAAMLIMLVVVVGNAVMTGVLVLFADLVAGPWLRPIVLAVYVGAVGAAYVSFLRPAAALLSARRENLAAALEGGEQG